ncbi:hypothetical protein CS063_00405 [Sporanaerobium hydrogeniformans]|uniref:Uncharacterized protein n=1 Tax=Sporanaerobium hydrogeniformans TaxID=3072179 RepID=A0AC61DFM4_9FIRM|nr:hypothetical protein [Sporanaerobium hydrogeniformans]PHV71971.1 hypothetical protein CS063_00405 [Sporanaerobium hydrogeniformans]
MEQVENKEKTLQVYAQQLTKELEDTFDCHPFALGGIVESHYIQREGFALALILLLTKKYIHTGNRTLIDKFLAQVKGYIGQSMEVLGENTVANIMSQFKEIKKNIN